MMTTMMMLMIYPTKSCGFEQTAIHGDWLRTREYLPTEPSRLSLWPVPKGVCLWKRLVGSSRDGGRWQDFCWAGGTFPDRTWQLHVPPLYLPQLRPCPPLITPSVGILLDTSCEWLPLPRSSGSPDPRLRPDCGESVSAYWGFNTWWLGEHQSSHWAFGAWTIHHFNWTDSKSSQSELKSFSQIQF